MTTLRPRTAGLDALRRQSFRAYYEPFNPKVEEKEEIEAHILQLELTDFDEQQIRVRVEEGARTVTVTGVHNAGNNRWLRLDKTYKIPENCIIDKIDHKFELGILTITMPKQITQPETAATAESAVAAPPPKEPEQPTPVKGNEEISPENAAKPPEEALPKDDSNNSAKPTDDGASAGAKEEAPPQTADKGPAKTTSQDQKIDSADQKPTDDGAKEEAPPQTADKGPAQGDSGEPKTTSQDQKIDSADQKPTEKREIENQIPKKGKESETEEVGKNQEEPKVVTGAPSPTAITAAKLTGRFKVVRVPSPATAKAILAAVMAIAVAAYFASVYFGLLATK